MKYKCQLICLHIDFCSEYSQKKNHRLETEVNERPVTERIRRIEDTFHSNEETTVATSSNLPTVCTI